MLLQAFDLCDLELQYVLRPGLELEAEGNLGGDIRDFDFGIMVVPI
jgi:hypothetical protein